MNMHLRHRLVLALLGLALLLVPVACGSKGPPPPPKVGEWVWGQNMALRIQKVDTGPLLVYARDNKYWQLLAPEGEQFVMVWVDIYQKDAGTMQLNPVSERVELRDAMDTKYTPIPITGGEVIESSPSGYYAPLFTEPVSLPPGNSISGWVAFVTPKGAALKELVWDEIDRITIRLS